MSEAPELLTARLRLRAAVENDAAGPYLQWMNDPEVTRYLESRFSAHTEADLRAFVASASRAGGVYLWAIELLDGKGARHVGNIKLGPVDEWHGTADIGLLLGERDVWGKGIATEAIDAVASWALGPLGLRKVTAGAYAVNAGSVTAFEKAGFHVEAVRRGQFVSDGELVDGVLLARFAAS